MRPGRAARPARRRAPGPHSGKTAAHRGVRGRMTPATGGPGRSPAPCRARSRGRRGGPEWGSVPRAGVRPAGQARPSAGARRGGAPGVPAPASGPGARGARAPRASGGCRPGAEAPVRPVGRGPRGPWRASSPAGLTLLGAGRPRGGAGLAPDRPGSREDSGRPRRRKADAAVAATPGGRPGPPSPRRQLQPGAPDPGPDLPALGCLSAHKREHSYFFSTPGRDLTPAPCPLPQVAPHLADALLRTAFSLHIHFVSAFSTI